MSIGEVFNRIGDNAFYAIVLTLCFFLLIKLVKLLYLMIIYDPSRIFLILRANITSFKVLEMPVRRGDFVRLTRRDESKTYYAEVLGLTKDGYLVMIEKETGNTILCSTESIGINDIVIEKK